MSNKRKRADGKQEENDISLLSPKAEEMLMSLLDNTRYNQSIRSLSDWFDADCSAVILEYARVILPLSSNKLDQDRSAKQSLALLEENMTSELEDVSDTKTDKEAKFEELDRAIDTVLELAPQTDALYSALDDTHEAAAKEVQEVSEYHDALCETKESVTRAIATLGTFDYVCAYLQLPMPVRKVMFELFRENHFALLFTQTETEEGRDIFFQCGSVAVRFELRKCYCDKLTTLGGSIIYTFKTYHTVYRSGISGHQVLAESIQRFVRSTTGREHEWIKTADRRALDEFNYELLNDLLVAGYTLEDILALLVMIRTAGDPDAFGDPNQREYDYLRYERLRSEHDTRGLLTIASKKPKP